MTTMKRSLTMLFRALALIGSFRRARAGNITLIVAFSAMPLVGIVGLTTDYSLMLSAKAKLDHAADAAVIAAITGTQTYLTNYTGSADVTAAAEAAGAVQGLAQFNANTGTIPSGTLTLTNPQVTLSGQVLTGTVSYSFTMPTVFMKMFGMRMATLSGSSTSSLTLPGYSNIYMLIDVSSSMGIGATLSDQQKVYNVTGGCAVACHYTGTTTTARLAGATLRIDVAKQAVIAALQQMQNSPTASKYKVAIYTMSDILTQVYPLSSNLSGAIAAVNTLDISNTNNDGGTDTSYALTQLNNQLPALGNGRTAATAQGTLMLITDGVQDSDMKYLSFGSWLDNSDPNFSTYSPCTQSKCQYFPTFGITVEAFDPTACAPIKAKQYTVQTLNVQYLVPPSNLQSSTPALNDVFTYIQQYLLQSIPANMAACATSPASAYSASTPAEITVAVASMFASVGTMARITQ
jgi:Flp pilus assembly protein TadG